MIRILTALVLLAAIATAKHDHKHKRSSKNIFEEEGLVQHREDKVRLTELNEVFHGPKYASPSKGEKHSDKIAHINPKKLKEINKSKEERKKEEAHAVHANVKDKEIQHNPKNLLSHKDEKQKHVNAMGLHAYHKNEFSHSKKQMHKMPAAHKKSKEQKKRLLKKERMHKKKEHERKTHKKNDKEKKKISKKY
ncbi:glutamic acid-rich protein-like [Artemia franciscana]|uniref:glutamic acid-rich protein-like n=1 Tax=Artemia franciscana TaxID=6661 RepID=UPI0032D9CD5C